jgi:hypothetical protein
MENQQLRQLQNTVEIVGTLKSKELEVKTSKAGNKYMTGKLVVLSKFDNKVQEQVIRVFIMASSKLFKGVETVKNEYKTIEEHGEENADRIKVTGELKLNEYYGQDGTLRQFNEIRGVFFNRLDPANDQPDKAIASIETVVEGYSEKMDKDGMPTGEYDVRCFTVGWGNEVIELKNVVIGSELAEAFMNLYQPGSTGRLTFKLNNYVETIEKEEEIQEQPQHGFGSTEKVETSNIINKYVNNLEIIGGDVPFMGSKEYTEEEIQAAKQVRALKLQELQKPAPATPPVNTGFGAGATTPQQPVETQMPFGLQDQMPDF